MTTEARVPWNRRLFAILSLVLSVLLLADVAQLLIGHGLYLLLGMGGLTMTVAGSWSMVSRRGLFRLFGAIGLLIGVGAILGSLVGTVLDADRIVIEMAIFGALTVLAVGSARMALLSDDRHLDEHHRRATGPPQHPVLLCNPWSGGGKVAKFGIVEMAEGMGVETVVLAKGLDLEVLARDAVLRGADCLGMAGGDGSQALVASIAVEHDLPFVCVTAGTRNHFALDLGLDRADPRNSLYAFRDAIERRVDYGTVNGRLFVNNVSLGVYATIVQEERYRSDKVGTSKAVLPTLLGEADEPFDLQFLEPSGNEVTGPFLVQVSNNPYVLEPSPDLSQRRSIDAGQLGIFAMTGRSGADAAQTMALSVLGQRRLSPNWHEFSATAFEVRSRSGKAFVGIDGEALEMETPLAFSIHCRGLQLLVPKGNLAMAERRRSRQAKLRGLFSVARGNRWDRDFQ